MSDQDVRAKLMTLGFDLEAMDSLISLRSSTDHPLTPPGYVLDVGANDPISDIAAVVLVKNGFTVAYRGKSSSGDLYVIWAKN